MRDWVFLSSHFDDVVLSVGGLVWELANRGDRLSIWTICAGDPPIDRPLSDYAQLLHILWEVGEQSVPSLRSLEDAACCRMLGASFLRYTMPDCIYRYYLGTGEPVVKVPDDINQPLEPGESYLLAPVADFIKKNLPEGCELVIPLAIGSHRDHTLTRKAAEMLGIPLWHYVDYPYVIREPYDIASSVPPGAQEFSLQVSPDGLKAWQDGIACHRSQLIFLFVDEAEMRSAIESYASTGGGASLWKF